MPSLQLAAGDEDGFDPALFDVASLQNEALRAIHAGFDELVEPNLFALTFQALQQAVDVGFGQVAYNVPTVAFREGLTVSVAHFAARKSYQQARDLATLLDNGGTRRSWASFRKLAQPILGTYNERWLKTEFNTAVRACRVANDLKQWEQPDNRRLYPNLRYMPSRAANPRDEHKPFYGIVRPIGDEFWVQHLPPSDWNCVCSVEPTDDEVTALPQQAPKRQAGLTNVAASGTVFDLTNPDGPYHPGDLAPDLDAAGEKAMLKLARKRAEAAAKARLVETGAQVLHPALPGPITFTTTGLKEMASRPNKHLLTLLTLMEEGLEEAIRTAIYRGFRVDYKGKVFVKGYHYLEVQLGGQPAYFNIREEVPVKGKQGKLTLYAVTDHLHQ